MWTPHATARPIAISSNGSDRKMSIMREMKVSVLPPRNPAEQPEHDADDERDRRAEQRHHAARCAPRRGSARRCRDRCRRRRTRRSCSGPTSGIPMSSVRSWLMSLGAAVDDEVREERGGEREHDQDEHDDGRAHRDLVALEPHPEELPGSATLDAGDLCVRWSDAQRLGPRARSAWTWLTESVSPLHGRGECRARCYPGQLGVRNVRAARLDSCRAQGFPDDREHVDPPELARGSPPHTRAPRRTSMPSEVNAPPASTSGTGSAVWALRTQEVAWSASTPTTVRPRSSRGKHLPEEGPVDRRRSRRACPRRGRRGRGRRGP